MDIIVESGAVKRAPLYGRVFASIRRNAATWILGLSALYFVFMVGRYGWITFGPPSSGPRIACDRPVFDCGEVESGQPLSHEFVLKNTGRQPLDIVSAAPDCALCLSVRVEPERIPPGSTGRVRVDVHTAELPKGAFKKAALITSNAAAEPRVRLLVRGSIR